MHERYMRELGLDEAHDGENIAALLEDMFQENSSNWQERAEGLLEETLKILKEKSLQDAMFYLGDRINQRDKERRLAASGERVIAEQRINFKELLQAASRKGWKPETRALAGSFNQEAVPAWYHEWKQAA